MCTTTKTEGEWLNLNTIELEKEKKYDFSAIKKAIGNKRIVALGESSHGLGEFYTLKSELVKYLHTEMGFEVIAMEGGLGDINLAYSNIDTLSFIELRNNSVFGNFRAQEGNVLYKHIKETSTSKNPLIFTGFDSQVSSDYMTTTLQNVLKSYDKPFADGLEEGFLSYYKLYQAKDSIGYYHHRDVFIKTATKAKKLLLKHQNEIDLTAFQIDILIRTMTNFERAFNFSYQEKYKGIGVRDQLMAENLEWIIDTLYPNKKVIIWGHNGHIEKQKTENGTIKFMGHYLKEKYADDYYALGIFAYKGECYMPWTNSYKTFENSETTYLESKLATTGKKTAYLNLEKIKISEFNEWLFKPINGLELESNGAISFIPTKRFDGVISVYESAAPTYE